MDRKSVQKRINIFKTAARFFFGLMVISPGNACAALITGLDFPGSAAVSGTMRFKFFNPHQDGLPVYGAPGKGITYIWRVLPRHQAGYYTAFFWGNDDGQNNLSTFLWTPTGGADSYYGAHPYPRGGGNAAIHDWEVSVEQNDFVNGKVDYGRWHIQALRVWIGNDGRKHHEFYWDVPSTDAAHKTTRISDSSWGNVNPPAPALIWGDAPWAPGNEVWCGILRGIQIYNDKLSLTDIANEIGNPLSTPAGAASIWYLNINPTPGDIADKSGKGHNPSWVGSLRPLLWSQNSDTQSPTTPENMTAVARSGTTVQLSWGASIDNVSVAGYRIYRNGAETAVSADATAQDTGLVPLTSYTYTIRAYDTAGNISPPSSAVTVKTKDQANAISPVLLLLKNEIR